VIQYHPHRTGANLRRKLVRCLAHKDSIYSRVGASDNPGAVQTAKLPPGTPIELWWQDEARVGQKTGITRRWARRGTRPSAPKDQRTASAYIFGAICPAEGKGAAIVMPRCNSEAMGMHLAEIAFHVAPGAHAVLILDQAGWHASAALEVPANITLLPLPPKCPELNPVENV